MPGELGGGGGVWWMGTALQSDEEAGRLGGDLGLVDETSANAAQRVGDCRRRREFEGGGWERHMGHRRHYLTTRALGEVLIQSFSSTKKTDT